MSLLDTASLIVTPNGYKASKLYSVKPTNGDGDMVVTRNTTATRVNSAGLIESVAFNAPRIDYPPLGGCPSILVEPLRINLALRSEEFDNVYWDKFSSGVASTPVVTANVETAPDGTTTADRVVFNLNSGTASGDISQLGSANFTSVSITRTQSVYIKTTDGTTKVFSFISPIGTLTAITVTSVYQRFTLTSTGINSNQIRLRLRGSASGEGTATSATIAIWGAQYEDGSNATSYIPTTTIPLTRNADVISKTGVSSLIGQTEGTVFIDFNNQVLNSTLLCINKNATNSIFFSTSNTGALAGRVYANGTNYFLSSPGYTTFNQKIKMCLKYGSFGTKLFINGVLVATQPTAIVFTSSLSSIHLNDDLVLFVNSTIKNNSTIIFKTALDNDQCIDLTN